MTSDKQLGEWEQQAFDSSNGNMIKLISEVRRLRKGFYLPVDCPYCTRKRVYYDPEGPSVECDKCEQKNWEVAEYETIWSAQLLRHLLKRADESLLEAEVRGKLGMKWNQTSGKLRTEIKEILNESTTH